MSKWQAWSHSVLCWRVFYRIGQWWTFWSNKWLDTALVMCWRFEWRQEPATQHRHSDRRGRHHPSLVLSWVSVCGTSSWKPLYKSQVHPYSQERRVRGWPELWWSLFVFTCFWHNFVILCNLIQLQGPRVQGAHGSVPNRPVQWSIHWDRIDKKIHDSFNEK